MKNRCTWVTDDQIYIDYHDKEWGIPVHDDEILFEFLILESFQAGLSWITILKKRENFRKAFDNYNYDQIALYGDIKYNELLNNSGIIRNKLKIRSAINNAQMFIKIKVEFGSFDKYIWRFVNYTPIINHWENNIDIPTKTTISDTISKDMKNRGFKFIGTTIIYAYMQAIGMVNDHLTSCGFR